MKIYNKIYSHGFKKIKDLMERIKIGCKIKYYSPSGDIKTGIVTNLKKECNCNNKIRPYCVGPVEIDGRLLSTCGMTIYYGWYIIDVIDFIDVDEFKV